MSYISRVLGSVLLTATYLFYSQSGSAEKPETEPSPIVRIQEPEDLKHQEKIAQALAWQNTKLKQLVELPASRSREIAKGLAELREHYRVSELRHQEIISLAKKAGPFFEKLLQSSIKQIANGDLQEQIIAVNNLKELNTSFIGLSWDTRLEHFIDTKGYAKSFAETALTKPCTNIKSYELLRDAGFIFVELTDPYPVYKDADYSYASRYSKWLSSEVSNSIKKSDKQKQYILEKGILDFITDRAERYSAAVDKEHWDARDKQSFELFQPLLISYKSIVQSNGTDPKILKNALKVFARSRTLLSYNEHNGNSIASEFNKASLSLFDTTLENIYKLPAQKDRQELKTIIFTDMPNYVYRDGFKRQEQIIETLNKHLKKNQNYNDYGEFMKFIDHIIDKNPQMNWESDMLLTQWIPDTVVMLVVNNPEYFKRNVENIIEVLKRAKDSHEQLKLRTDLYRVFKVLSDLPHLVKSRGFVQPGSGEELYIRLTGTSEETVLKLKNWVKEKIEKPIFDAFHLYLHDFKNPLLLKLARQRIIELPLPNTKEAKELEKQFSEKGLSEYLASKDGKYFISTLKEREKSLELKPNQTHSVLYARILAVDASLYRALLPELKDNNKALDSLLQLRKNAFISLCDSINLDKVDSYSEYMFYKEKVPNFLENNLEKYGTRETLPKILGEEVAALIKTYYKLNINKQEKLAYLKQCLFNGFEQPNGKETLYISTPLFKHIESEFIDLAPGKNRKILDNLYRNPARGESEAGERIRGEIFKMYPKLQERYKEMRRQFATVLVNKLSEDDFLAKVHSLGHLKSLGFTEEELAKIF